MTQPADIPEDAIRCIVCAPSYEDLEHLEAKLEDQCYHVKRMESYSNPTSMFLVWIEEEEDMYAISKWPRVASVAPDQGVDICATVEES